MAPCTTPWPAPCSTTCFAPLSAPHSTPRTAPSWAPPSLLHHSLPDKPGDAQRGGVRRSRGHMSKPSPPSPPHPVPLWPFLGRSANGIIGHFHLLLPPTWVTGAPRARPRAWHQPFPPVSPQVTAGFPAHPQRLPGSLASRICIDVSHWTPPAVPRAPMVEGPSPSWGHSKTGKVSAPWHVHLHGLHNNITPP